MMAWLAQHRHAVAAACARFAAAPLGTALNVLALGIALSLPVALLVLIDNLQKGAQHITAEPQLSLYIDLSATRDQALEIGKRLASNAGVRGARFVPREQALQELKQNSGLADVIDTLPGNPLPDAYVIDPRDGSPPALAALRSQFAAMPHVAQVELDAAWARRLDAGLRLGRLIVAIITALLALALIAITFNTVRLQVLTQREEIEVAKLIGATDTYVRRPFLYYGALQGCAGALLGWLIVAGGVWLVNRNLAELSQVYSSLFELQYPNHTEVIELVAGAIAVNWFGAFLSVGRHLTLVEPGRH